MRDKDYSEYPVYVQETVERTDAMIEQLEQIKELLKNTPAQVEAGDLDRLAGMYTAVGFNATSTGIALQVAKERMIAAGLCTTGQEKN